MTEPARSTGGPLRIGVLATSGELAAHLREGAPLLTDADDAVATMELVDDTYRAAGLAPRPRHVLRPGG